jgi:hypothetical protein
MARTDAGTRSQAGGNVIGLLYSLTYTRAPSTTRSAAGTRTPA